MANLDQTSVPWRTGRSLDRTIYARTGGDDWKNDTVIGMMDTPELARAACDAHNVLADLAWLLDMGMEARVIHAGAGLEVVLTDGEGCRVGTVEADPGTGIAAALQTARAFAEAEGYGP